MVKFKTTKEEFILIGKIVKRAISLHSEWHPEVYTELCMDLSAVHSNDVKLDFKKLSEADDFNLLHDVIGINHHIDRTTGKLTRCFLPRCSM